MYTEEDLLPISALQHLLFCPRQCALIHLEQAWSENQLTAQGRQLHDRAHDAPSESRGDLRIVRGLRLASPQLGLSGQADVVELHLAGPDTPASQQGSIPGLDGKWSVYPVEYKRGRPKQIDCDRVQLCAQAICLEEMLHVHIPEGSLFYGEPRRREQVALDAALRRQTHQAAADLHQLIQSGITPPPEYSPKCRSCSLIQACLPKELGRGGRVQAYLHRQIEQSLGPDVPEEHDSENP